MAPAWRVGVLCRPTSRAASATEASSCPRRRLTGKTARKSFAPVPPALPATDAAQQALGGVRARVRSADAAEAPPQSSREPPVGSAGSSRGESPASGNDGESCEEPGDDSRWRSRTPDPPPRPRILRLERGSLVTATVALPRALESAAARAVPARVSLRVLLDAKRGEEVAGQLGEGPPEHPRRPEALAGLSSLQQLPQVGRRDRLSEAIRSMESRLARQGLLAAPTSILGARGGGKEAADPEKYYDASDALIDDADLEEVNAADREGQCEEAADAESAGEGSCYGAALDSGEAADEHGAAAARGRIDLSAFCLADDEVSGTDEEPESADEGGLAEGLPRKGEDWREALSRLHDELTPVPLDPMLARIAPAHEVVVDVESDCEEQPSAAEASVVVKKEMEVDEPEHAATASASSEAPAAESRQAAAMRASLERLKAALTSVCEAIEEAHGRGQEHGAAESALQRLWHSLPALFRAPAGSASIDGGPARWRLKTEVAAASSSLRSRGAPLFAWSSAEEAAWTRLVWGLVREASSGSIQRKSFLQHWAAAASPCRKHWLENGEMVAMRRVRSAIMHGDRFAMAQKAARSWPKFLKVTSRSVYQRHLHAIQPLAKALPALWECWTMRRFWEQPRLCPAPPAPLSDEGDLAHAFGEYVAKQARDRLKLDMPLEMVVELIKSHSSGLAEGREASKPMQEHDAILACLPIALPKRIFIALRPGSVVECTLESVRSLKRQRVLLHWNAESGVKEHKSLQSAMSTIREALKRRRVGIGPSLGRALRRRHGAWEAFRCQVGTRTLSLAMAVKVAKAKGVVAFKNAPGVEPCPVLPAPCVMPLKRPLAKDTEREQEELPKQKAACTKHGRPLDDLLADGGALQAAAAAAAASSASSSPTSSRSPLEPGARVRFRDGACKVWMRGRVVSDSGSEIQVETADKSNPARKIRKSLPASNVESVEARVQVQHQPSADSGRPNSMKDSAAGSPSP